MAVGKGWWWAAGVVAAILMLSVASQIDDPLSDGAAQWLAAYERSQQGESEGFLLLVGLGTAANEDSLESGRRWHQQLQQWAASHSAADEGVDAPQLPNRLPLPEDKQAFCKLGQPDCGASLIRGDWQPLLASHQQLRQRYRRLLAATDYRTQLPAHAAVPLPDYRLLMRAHRLQQLAVIGDAALGPQQRLDMLASDLEALRRQLVVQDCLIGRVFHLKLVADQLELMAAWLAEHPQLTKPVVAELSVNERDLSPALYFELALNAALMREIESNPQFYRHDWPQVAPLVRAVFKPQMSINALHQHLAQYANLSRQPQAQFGAGVAALSGPQSNRLRNWMGSVLTQVAAPAFSQYVARAFDLNCKIALFNGHDFAAASLQPQLNPPAVANPYGDGQPAYVSDDGGAICLSGPLADDQQLRCLRAVL